jgi:transposase
MKTYYIGADVHSNSTELAIEYKDKLVGRYSVPTTVPAIKQVLSSVEGKKHLTMEEGPMAGWLCRSLKDTVDEIIVCDPRRNKLICSDGDADDKIDAGKLASLLRGGFLKAIYHSNDIHRVELKQWVNLYHDRVRDAVRNINKLRGKCRQFGLSISRSVLRKPEYRRRWLIKANNPILQKQLELLWIGYDAAAQQVRIARRQLNILAKRYQIIKQWSALPGIGLIRAITHFAYLDTPWRFKRKNRLWKYCGVGLQRTASGSDKKGKPKPAKLQLPWAVNRILKNVTLGAALSAINQNKNIFRDYYERMISDEVVPSNARHAVARKMLTVMYGMWKTNSVFDKKLCKSLEQKNNSVVLSR